MDAFQEFLAADRQLGAELAAIRAEARRAMIRGWNLRMQELAVRLQAAAR